MCVGTHQPKEATDLVDGADTAQEAHEHGEGAHTYEHIGGHLQRVGLLLCTGGRGGERERERERKKERNPCQQDEVNPPYLKSLTDIKPKTGSKDLQYNPTLFDMCWILIISCVHWQPEAPTI